MALLRTVPRLTRPFTSRITLLRRHNGARSFSFAAIKSSGSQDAAELVALLPASAMEAMHSVGLPWYAVLPMSAVLFRSLVVYPLFQRPAREKLVRRINIQPLVDAKMSSERRNRSHIKNMTSADKIRLWIYHSTWVKKLEYELFDQSYKLERISSFLTLIAVSDGLRRLCGAKAGLLSTLLGPFDVIVRKFQDFGTGFREFIEKSAGIPAVAPDQSVDTISTSATSATSAAVPIESPWFEPSLLDGGFSWCADLTVADPTLILPILFSTSFFASIYFSPRVDRPASEGPPKATNMQRIGMTVAVLSFIPALQMPSALLLYFIANMGVGQLQARWLAYTLPISPVPTGCSRPIRVRYLNEIV